MEISKKKLILFTIFLIVLGGTATFAFSGKPEDLSPLWERIWKVEEPVEVYNPSQIEVVLEEEIDGLDAHSSHWITLEEVNKYKNLYLYYIEESNTGSIDCIAYYTTSQPTHTFEVGRLTYDEPLEVQPLKIEVASPTIKILVHNISDNDYTYHLWITVYGSIK
jgi:hypothetical protein